MTQQLCTGLQYIDGHESKPAMCILANIEESQKTSIISYFAIYSIYDQTFGGLNNN